MPCSVSLWGRRGCRDTLLTHEGLTRRGAALRGFRVSGDLPFTQILLVECICVSFLPVGFQAWQRAVAFGEGRSGGHRLSGALHLPELEALS